MFTNEMRLVERGKGKNRVELIKSLIYARVARGTYRGAL